MIIDRLQKAGHEVFIAGGAVRDMLLDKSVYDCDITTSASPDEIINLFNDLKIDVGGTFFKVVIIRSTAKQSII